MASLAIDLGGTYFRSAVVLEDGSLHSLEETRVRSIFDGASPTMVWEGVADLVSRASFAARGALRDNDPAIIAFPGPIAGGRRIVSAPTLTGSAVVPADLRERFIACARRPVRFVNDLAAAARHLADAVPESRFIVVTVSSGIGSRVVVRGGSHEEPAYAGEIGHVVVDHGPTGVLCDCGGRGHLGAIASGRAIERAARAKAHADRKAFAQSLCATRYDAVADSLTNERHLVPALLAGDVWARGVVDPAVRALARMLSGIVVAAGLERVYVIGGFATALGETYRAMLVSALHAVQDSPAISIDAAELVRIATLNERACLRGAALFA
jgi:glucokinase